MKKKFFALFPRTNGLKISFCTIFWMNGMNAGEVGTTIQIKAPIFAPPSPLIFTDLLLGFASHTSVFPPAAISLMNPDAGFNICTSMTN